MTSIVRKIAELGRVVLPIELRKELNLNERDGLEITVLNGGIFLKKAFPSCFVCGETSGLIENKGKCLCSSCLNDFEAANIK